MIEFLDNDELWKPKEYFQKNKICSLCYSNHPLSFSHISNAIHKNNVLKLGNLEYWKIPEDKLFSYLHSKKTTKSYRGKK
jgi:hypothetical protein